MISITCTQCQTVLTIDDAFAGGVCRCQYCGTIQTVPSALKPNPVPGPFAGPTSTQSKTLYQNQASRTAGVNVAATGVRTSSGLDDLAHAVGESSGLSGSSLRGAYVAPPAATGAATQNAVPRNVAPPVAPIEPEAPAHGAKKLPLIPILIGVGVVIVALLGVIIFLVVHQFSSGGATGGTTGGTDANGMGGPGFGGAAISGSRVVYLLDDANSISNDFDPLRALTLQSINSLGSDRKFAVILWNNGDQFAFPKEGLAPANASQVDALRAAIQDIAATGQSQLRPSLERAISLNPDAIIIVTEKSSLQQDDQKALATAQENSGDKFKLYTFNVGAADDDPVLKMAAKATGGEYHHLTSQQLRSLTP